MLGDDGHQASKAIFTKELSVTHSDRAIVKSDGDRITPGETRACAEQAIDLSAQPVILTTFGLGDSWFLVQRGISAS